MSPDEGTFRISRVSPELRVSRKFGTSPFLFEDPINLKTKWQAILIEGAVTGLAPLRQLAAGASVRTQMLFGGIQA